MEIAEELTPGELGKTGTMWDGGGLNYEEHVTRPRHPMVPEPDRERDVENDVEGDLRSI
jgi:hypothetical protein